MNIGNEKFRTYQPIDSYRMIGDYRSVLLVAPDGAIDWGRLPDFDSPAIFCRLLDMRRGGYFQIAPTDTTIAGSQHYLHDSSVLRTTFASKTGTIVLTDFMPIETLEVQPRHTADKKSTAIHHRVVRQVACLEGEMPITMMLKVTPNYGYAPCAAFVLENNTGAVFSGNRQYIGLFVAGERCVTAFRLRLQDDEMHSTISAQVILHEGERIQFILGTASTLGAVCALVETDLPRRNFDWELAQTLSNWRKWATDYTYHHSPHQATLSFEQAMRRTLLARPAPYGPNYRKPRAGYRATRRVRQ